MNHLETGIRVCSRQGANSGWLSSVMAVWPGLARESARDIDEASARAYVQVITVTSAIAEDRVSRTAALGMTAVA